MAIAIDKYPNWDGTSDSRNDRRIDRGPNAIDWNKITAEYLGMQGAIKDNDGLFTAIASITMSKGTAVQITTAGEVTVATTIVAGVLEDDVVSGNLATIRYSGMITKSDWTSLVKRDTLISGVTYFNRDGNLDSYPHDLALPTGLAITSDTFLVHTQSPRQQFLPSDILKCRCWLDSEVGLLNTVAAFPSDGDLINSWTDRVNSLVFNQTITAQKPTYKTMLGANGRPYLDFNGILNNLIHSGSFPETSGEMLIVCEKNIVNGDTNGFFGAAINGTENPWIAFWIRADSAGNGLVYGNSGGGNIESSSNFLEGGPANLINIRNDGTNGSMFVDDVSIITPAAVLWFGDITGHDTVTVGGLRHSVLSVPYQGKIYEIIVFDEVLTDTERANVLRYLKFKYHPLLKYAALGDSLTRSGGDGQWVVESDLSQKDKDIEGVGTVEFAVGSRTTTQGVTVWTDDIQSEGYQGIVVMLGINDALFSVPAATVILNLEQIVDEAISDGFKVILSTISPFGNNPGWTQAFQDVINTVNAWARAKVDADITKRLSLLESYDTLRDGINLDDAFDSGDGLHWNQAGDIVVAGEASKSFAILNWNSEL